VIALLQMYLFFAEAHLQHRYGSVDQATVAAITNISVAHAAVMRALDGSVIA